MIRFKIALALVTVVGLIAATAPALAQRSPVPLNIFISTPANGTSVHGPTISVNGQALDEFAFRGINVFVQVDGGVPVLATGILRQNGYVFSWRCSLATDNLALGPHTIGARLVGAGGETASTSVVVTLMSK